MNGAITWHWEGTAKFVWPLGGVKLDYLFSDIFLNISKTVWVGSVKFPIMYAPQRNATLITYNTFPYNGGLSEIKNSIFDTYEFFTELWRELSFFMDAISWKLSKIKAEWLVCDWSRKTAFSLLFFFWPITSYTRFMQIWTCVNFW